MALHSATLMVYILFDTANRTLDLLRGGPLFHQSSNRRIGTVVLIVATLVSVSAAQKPSTGTDAAKPVRLVGRVLADVSSFAFGAGLGPQYTTFVFAVEQGGTRVEPMKVSYAFFKSEGPPPDSFFDYSKRYELQAVRDTKCDESVDSLSHVKNVDQSGKPLPPSDALRFLDGAPKDALKSDAILPCYVLRPGKYKVLSQDKESKMETVDPKTGNVHLTIPIVASKLKH